MVARFDMLVIRICNLVNQTYLTFSWTSIFYILVKSLVKILDIEIYSRKNLISKGCKTVENCRCETGVTFPTITAFPLHEPISFHARFIWLIAPSAKYNYCQPLYPYTVFEVVGFVFDVRRDHPINFLIFATHCSTWSVTWRLITRTSLLHALPFNRRLYYIIQS